MKLAASRTPAAEAKVDLLVIGVTDTDLAKSPVASALDAALSGVLSRAAQQERFRAKPGQSVVVHTFGKAAAGRVAIVGLGSETKPTDARELAARATRLANAVGAVTAAVALPTAFDRRDLDETTRLVELLAEGAELGGYKFETYLSDDKRTPRSLTEMTFHLPLPEALETADAAVSRGQRLAAAVSQARDLVNEPAAALTPTRLAEIARDLATKHGLDATIMGRDDCRKLGMGLYLAVSAASVEEPKFIHLAWRPAGAKKRVVLVGKGVTFDSGGLTLKPNDSMLDMKTDMAGAAAVLSAMALVATERLPVEVHALAACTENMISGSSYKLGDVLRSKAGKTVEINNTDAEGRLTLADAITYGLELKPDALLDFATLTGACMVALGPHIAGVMSNDEPLATAWLDAAKAAGEEMWRLPLPPRLADQLKSEIADMKNTGERWGGALTAGLFLKEFVGTTPWVHVDLAGPSTADKDGGATAKGGTGFGVGTIFEFLRRFAAT